MTQKGELVAYAHKNIREISTVDIHKLIKFFSHHKVKVIEKDSQPKKEENLYNRHSGRSSVRQSQSIEGSERSQGGMSQDEDDYQNDSFVIEDEEPKQKKDKKDKKQSPKEEEKEVDPN